MQNIQVRPVRDLRNNYAEIEAIINAHDPVVITKNGRGAAVLLNIEDFSDYEEFMHIKYVAEKLKEAEAYEDDESQWFDCDEVMKELRDKYGV